MPRAVGITHPFRMDRDFDRIYPEGVTIEAIVRDIGPRDGCQCLVWVDGRPVEPAEWPAFRPREGAAILMRVLPSGGGGNDPNKTWRMVAMVGVIALGGWAASGITSTLWSGLAQAGIVAGGAWGVNQLLPPPEAESALTDQTKQPPSLSGARNRIALGSPFPVVLGRCRVTPPIGGAPYTELEGDRQYLRLLLILGYDVVGSDIRFGKTSIDEYEDVEYEYLDGSEGEVSQLYSGSVFEESMQVKLERPDAGTDNWTTRTTEDESDEFSVDVTVPALFRTKSDGSRSAVTVRAEGEFRKTGSADPWLPFGQGAVYVAEREFTASHFMPEFRRDPLTGWVRPVETDYRVGVEKTSGHVRVFAGTSVPDTHHAIAGIVSQYSLALTDLRSAAVQAMGFAPTLDGGTLTIAEGTLDSDDALTFRSSEPGVLRRGICIRLPEPGQYDVRMQRVQEDAENSNTQDGIYWTALRSIRHTKAVAKTGIKQLAIRVRATDQISGQLENINLLLSLECLDWDSTSETWVKRVTDNPASVYRWLLQGPACSNPLADSVIDLEALADWHDYCAERGFACDLSITSGRPLADWIKIVCACGRARRAKVNGLHSVVIDDERPVEHIFTNANTLPGYTGSKILQPNVHALRCSYIDGWRDKAEGVEGSWEVSERVVYADGYDEATATEFRRVEYVGIADAAQVWKRGRYDIAAAELRPETHQVPVALQSLACRLGQRVLLQAEQALAGIGAAAVVSRVENPAGFIESVTLEGTVEMDAATLYGCVYQLRTGEVHEEDLDTTPGESATLTFAAAVAIADAPEVGDIVGVGIRGIESRDLLITGIDRRDEASAVVTMIDYAPAVFDADTGEIPAFDPGLSRRIDPETLQPAVPEIVGIQSSREYLVRSADGSYSGRMLVSLAPGSDGETPTEWFRVQARPSGGLWRPAVEIPASVGAVSITDIVDGETYDIRARAVAANGAVSEWSDIEDHTAEAAVIPSLFDFMLANHEPVTAPSSDPCALYYTPHASNIKGGGRWRAFTINGVYAYSDDYGDTWTTVAVVPGGISKAAAAINDDVLVFAVDGTVYYSDDNGATWTNLSFGIKAYDLVWSEELDKFLLVGEDGFGTEIVALVSAAGDVVTAVSSPWTAGLIPYGVALIEDPHTFIAGVATIAGANPCLMVSADGENWTQGAALASRPVNVRTSGNGVVVIGCIGGEVYWTLDGFTVSEIVVDSDVIAAASVYVFAFRSGYMVFQGGYVPGGSGLDERPVYISATGRTWVRINMGSRAPAGPGAAASDDLGRVMVLAETNEFRTAIGIPVPVDLQ